MKCPTCSSDQLLCYNTRLIKGERYRWHKCATCGTKIKTIEKIVGVKQSDDRWAPFRRLTFREKLKRQHPGNVDDCYVGGCWACPSDYWNVDDPYYCNSDEESCGKCWDRIIPEELED